MTNLRDDQMAILDRVTQNKATYVNRKKYLRKQLETELESKMDHTRAELDKVIVEAKDADIPLAAIARAMGIRGTKSVYEALERAEERAQNGPGW